MRDTQLRITHCPARGHTYDPGSSGPRSCFTVTGPPVEGWATSTELPSGGHMDDTSFSSAASTLQAATEVYCPCKGFEAILHSSVDLLFSDHVLVPEQPYLMSAQESAWVQSQSNLPRIKDDILRIA